MMLSMMIRAAAIDAPALFACARPAAAQSQICTDDFLNPVPFVVTPYAPATNTTPTAQTPQKRPVNSDVQMDVAAAFLAASSDFRSKICGLDGIFIDPSGCADPGPGNTYDPTTCKLSGTLITGYSWGLRTYSPNSSPGKRYIGLSLGLWNYKNASLPRKYRWSCFLPKKYAPRRSAYFLPLFSTLS
jgi:hypothetical protein